MMTVRDLITALNNLPESEKSKEFAAFNVDSGERTVFNWASLNLWRGRIEIHGTKDPKQ